MAEISSSRHSEPNVNHGEESYYWITKQMSVIHKTKEILQHESAPTSGW